jgi:predicted small secreted protein
MPMMKAPAALLLASLPLAGCATLFGQGESAVHHLALGQTGDFGPVNLTPISVDEDSRCPASVQCIWAGQVRVKVLVEPAGANHAVFATLGQPLGVDGGTLLVEQVTPQRTSTAQIPPSHYSFTLRYTPAA